MTLGDINIKLVPNLECKSYDRRDLLTVSNNYYTLDYHSENATCLSESYNDVYLSINSVPNFDYGDIDKEDLDEFERGYIWNNIDGLISLQWLLNIGIVNHGLPFRFKLHRWFSVDNKYEKCDSKL